MMSVHSDSEGDIHDGLADEGGIYNNIHTSHHVPLAT
jgi:hypothetical protein